MYSFSHFDFDADPKSHERQDTLDATSGDRCGSKKPFVVCVTSNETSLRLRTPARGIRCKHSTCFDLEHFLQRVLGQNRDERPLKDEWQCPLCGRNAPPHELYVCKYTEKVVRMCETGALPCDTKMVMFEGGNYKVFARSNK